MLAPRSQLLVPGTFDNANKQVQGVPAQRVFWGKETIALCEIALCGSYFSTKVQNRGKKFFKVHFLGIFSNLELCIVHQINAIFIAHSIFDKIYLYGLKGGYDALNFLDILIPNIKVVVKILKINHFNRIL